MEILKHRANKIEDIDYRYGCEIDVRDAMGRLVLSHDPACGVETAFDEYLKHINKNQMIAINSKSSEIELEIYKAIQDNNITNYFTFDWSMPSLIKALQSRLTCACRLSEYETKIISGCSWVWIDSFHEIWYDLKFLESIHNEVIRIALVSPEIHKRNMELKKIKDIVNTGIIDAICTDIPEYYQ
jgi:hypothetical protein